MNQEVAIFVVSFLAAGSAAGLVGLGVMVWLLSKRLDRVVKFVDDTFQIATPWGDQRPSKVYGLKEL